MSENAKATILVVEDEFWARLDLMDRLQCAGYRTLTAENADVAIDLLAADRSIRAVFTDILMPGTMDGLELAYYIQSRWPQTIIVVSSGNMPPDASLLPKGVHVLTKPYAQLELARILAIIAGEL